jgi:hypothetical protein
MVTVAPDATSINAPVLGYCVAVVMGMQNPTVAPAVKIRDPDATLIRSPAGKLTVGRLTVPPSVTVTVPSEFVVGEQVPLEKQPHPEHAAKH